MAVVLFSLAMTISISLFIAFTHKWTHTGLSYSQSFFATLVLVGVIASIIMIVVQNNIFGALGILGAFALIRFRTILKETRDIAFVFLSLAEGVAVGLNHYAIALTSTAIICFLAYVMFKFKLGSVTDRKFILLVTAKSPIDHLKMNSQLASNGLSMDMLSSKKRSDETFEYTFSLAGKNINSADKLMSELAHSYGIMEYDLVSGRESIEY